MRVIETVKIPATPERTEERHTGTICDLCKKMIPMEGWYEVREVDVSHHHKVSVQSRVGTYPEGARVEVTEADLCLDCFDTKLIPWLESQGAYIKTREESW